MLLSIKYHKLWNMTNFEMSQNMKSHLFWNGTLFKKEDKINVKAWNVAKYKMSKNMMCKKYEMPQHIKCYKI